MMVTMMVMMMMRLSKGSSPSTPARCYDASPWCVWQVVGARLQTATNKHYISYLTSRHFTSVFHRIWLGDPAFGWRERCASATFLVFLPPSGDLTHLETGIERIDVSLYGYMYVYNPLTDVEHCRAEPERVLPSRSSFRSPPRS